MTSTSTWAVTPGEWYAVLGETTVVLLPPASKDRAPAIWEKVDDGAGFDEVLDALISEGLRKLPGFVLANADQDGEVKVVVRGAGEVELQTREGPQRVVGSPDTTWVERNVTGVTRIRIRVAESDSEPYQVGGGLVRASEVRRPPGLHTAPAAPAPASAAPAPPPPVPAPPASPERKRILPPPPPELVHAGGEPVTEPVPLAPSGAHVAPAPPPPGGRPTPRLVFSSGEIVDVDRVVVVGRAPDPSRATVGSDVRPVSVPSPNQEISSTHVEIRPGSGDGDGVVVVTDLGSTNGTVVVQPGNPAQDLQPGIGVELRPGALIDLGEGQTIQVTTA
jgi:hypothetical protein